MAQTTPVAGKGRQPYDDPSEVKRKMIGVRVNEEELAQLEAAALRDGFKKVSTWLRWLGFGRDVGELRWKRETASKRPSKKSKP